MAVADANVVAEPVTAAASAPVPGSLWREWEPRNLAHNAVSLGGELLESLELHRLAEADRALQEQVLPRLVGEEREDSRGGTRLHHAAEKDRSGRARALLAAGASPRARDRFSTTPLARSAWSELANGAVGVLLIRDKAAYPTTASFVELASGEVLHCAARLGKSELVAALLERGVDPDVRDFLGQTTLHWAVIRRQVRVMEVLLDAGAEVDAMDFAGRTPLQLAAKGRSVEVVRLLLDRGAAVNHHAADGRTALFHACESGRLEAAQLLVERGADATIPMVDGTTPLKAAQEKGRKAVVAWLEALLDASATQAEAAAGGGSE